MKRFGLAMMAVLALAGVARAQVNDDPTGPQPMLPTEQLSITADDGKVYNFTVELAATPQEQAYGLMFRPTVAADAGMLFPNDPPVAVQFWMKNTIAPLDMVFIGPDGKIISIAENTVPYSLRPIPSGGIVAATLELQGGITATDDINIGDKVVAKQFGGG
ncbi:DUF192 domain-containing protein [Acidocella sp.]|uniref:DUF192 domain-containing protein n=1 Tax=Acidocella sp. TaxID=50710 RepID=UPI00263635B3|nr:DUF192 domain-containing protein [Acidocella sp.]